MFARATVYPDQSSACFTQAGGAAIELLLLTPAEWKPWFASQSPQVRQWVEHQSFTAKPETYCWLPNEDGDLRQVLVGVANLTDVSTLAFLPNQLKQHEYRVVNPLTHEQWINLALGWGMACYRFQMKQSTNMEVIWPQLQLADEVLTQILPVIEAIHYVRDLINQPANIMDPAALAQQALTLAKTHHAKCKMWVGSSQLQRHQFPAIAAVGQASHCPPHLIDLQWGNNKHPKVTLIGKGVCFDSGGLNLKPGNSMRLMKKDMGGAAHALGLAKMIMHAQLPVHLRVLIPAVENAIGSRAYRPGDVLTMRNKTTVEIDNTDAEGRLLLADALSFASEESPALIIDFATLTGAARVALGTDVPAMFSNNDAVAMQLMQCAEQTQDPIWRLPLVAQYKKMLHSDVADWVNSAASSYAGAITAALFLQQFVAQNIPWVHFDLMAWNVSHRPGHPVGGEAMALRGVFHYLANYVAEWQND